MTLRKIRNISRSPNPYEFKNQYEHFAVNSTLFLQDPSYKCRRPSLYSFFKDRLDHIPFKNIECNPITKISIKSKNEAIEINLDKVYQIHYLLADRGDSTMSK